jgi:arginine N-succinyltransferase
MVVIRPVREEDLEQLIELAGTAGFGLTSLPKDAELLGKRIVQSLRSFRIKADAPGGELYLFVMEDSFTHRIVGTSCIVSKVGGFEPFYAYRIKTSVHESSALKIRTEIPTLHLVVAHSGPCEIGGLFLSPDYRKRGSGRLLSLFRFLFMAEHPGSFEPLVIAEMRGVVDEDGHSPFWEALGRHFFDMEFPKADYLSVKDKRFIADLMPQSPIYIPLLEKGAQEVIGRVANATRPALKMLQNEGFKYTGMVDIFEAGPIISCRLEDIRIVQESRDTTVEEIETGEIESDWFIVTNTVEEFRATMGPAQILPGGGARLTEPVAKVLEVGQGDRVRIGPVRPSAPDMGKE